MNTNETIEQRAKSMYPTATNVEKATLEKLLGKSFFRGSIIDRVKTFEEACSEKGVDPLDMLPYEDPKNKFHNAVNAFAKMTIITEVLNEGWTPDWENEREYKWAPYFRMKSGFGFSRTICDSTRTGTAVGSRLCFKSQELADYAGKQFESVYKEYLTL